MPRTSRRPVLPPAVAVRLTLYLEAVREFQVVTNQYDVTSWPQRRWHSKRGNQIRHRNQLTGSGHFNYSRADWLSSRYDIRGNQTDQQVCHPPIRFLAGRTHYQRQAALFCSLGITSRTAAR